MSFCVVRILRYSCIALLPMTPIIPFLGAIQSSLYPLKFLPSFAFWFLAVSIPSKLLLLYVIVPSFKPQVPFGSSSQPLLLSPLMPLCNAFPFDAHGSHFSHSHGSLNKSGGASLHRLKILRIILGVGLILKPTWT